MGDNINDYLYRIAKVVRLFIYLFILSLWALLGMNTVYLNSKTLLQSPSSSPLWGYNKPFLFPQP